MPCAKLAPSIRCLLIELVQTVLSLKRNVVYILNCVLLELTAKKKVQVSAFSNSSSSHLFPILHLISAFM